MSTPVLFIDRDGTLIEEPADFQIDSFDKLRFVAGVIPALLRLRDAGWEFVIVSNQDGLGTDAYPQASFDGPHALMLHVFESQGITFREVLIDRSVPEDNLPTRKPGIGLVLHYLRDRSIDLGRSAVVGDRDTDLALAANMGIRGFMLRGRFGGEWSWEGIAHELVGAPRRALVERTTRETTVRVELGRDRTRAGRRSAPRPGRAHHPRDHGPGGAGPGPRGRAGDLHGAAVLRPHARADRDARRDRAGSERRRRPAYRRASHRRGH